MNENDLVDLEQSAENGVFDAEFVSSNTEYSENAVVDGIDSIDSNGDLSVMDETSTNVESGTAETIVYTTEIETYYNAELGGYPVVIVNDISDNVATVADYEDYYTTLSTTWEDYFSGVLANMGDTDYMAYCLRDYVSSSYSSYTDHYVLYYDLEVENGALVSGTYPYMDIYRDGSYGYICNEGSGTLSSVPFPAYGSFGNLSDFRKGVSHDEMWTLLFAVGFAVVYSVCTRIFDYVWTLRSGSKG